MGASAEKLIADLLQPQLRPDIDASTIAVSILEHLRTYGFEMRDLREDHVRGAALTALPPEQVVPRHLSSDMLQVYCAALTGLIAAGADRDGAVRGAMMCVEATALATK